MISKKLPCNFIESHPIKEAPRKICNTPAEHLPLGEHLLGTISVCQKSFKRLKWKVVKKILLPYTHTHTHTHKELPVI